MYVFFRVLPLRVSQQIAMRIGWLLSKIHPASRIIECNLHLTQFPTNNRAQFVSEVWGHCAALLAEYAHTHSYSKLIHTHLHVKGHEHLEAFNNSLRAGIFAGAHIGNWGLAGAYIHAHARTKVAMVHRPPNNWVLNTCVHYIQAPFADVIVEKNIYAGQKLVRLLNDNVSIFMLIDQKNNAGISLPFLKREAKATPGAALLTYKHNRPILPFMCQRNTDGTFTLTFSPVIWPHDFSNTPEPVRAITQKLNNLCEQWIRQAPTQWLWLHKRFHRSLYRPK